MIEDINGLSLIEIKKVVVENLKNYIELIKDKDLRDIIYNIVTSEKSLRCFYYSSSSSGLYHPQDENVSFGQLWHTIKVIHLAIVAYKRYSNINKDNIDFIIASAILHDIPYKFDFSGTKVKSNTQHPLLNSQEFIKVASEFSTPERYIIVQRLIANHMGKWSSPHPTYYDDKPFCELSQVIHDADYFASRKNVSIDTDFSYFLNNYNELNMEVG